MRKKIIIIAFIFVLLSIPVATLLVKQNLDNREHASGLSPTVTPTPTIAPTQTSVETLDNDEWNFLNIINAHRQSMGLSTLKISTTLEQAAKWEANDLSQRGVLSHTDSLGRDPQARTQAFGYSAPGGENVAASPGDAQSAFNQFLSACDQDSSGVCQYTHKQNMENSGWEAIGIAHQQYSTEQFQGDYAWVTDFGSVLDNEITPPTGDTTTPTLTPTEPTTPSPTTIVITQPVLTDTPTQAPTEIPPTNPDNPTIQPTATPTIFVPNTPTPTFTPTPTSSVSATPTAQTATLTPTPSIANPGGITQTFGIVVLGIGIILGGIFLLVL